MSDPERAQDTSGANLVPVTEQQTPLFELTPKHKETLEQMTVSYMQRSKIPFDSNGLSLGKEIVADALHRGMEANDVTGIEASTNLRALIKEGMNKRTHIAQGATRVYREYRNEMQSGDDRFIGPYALPARQLSRVGREVSHADVSLLGESEKLNDVEAKRIGLLPHMANAIISGLPRGQFPDVSLDMFPDASSQAKLVRNSIASMWFRGNPLPMFQINDLQQFTDRADEPLDPKVLVPLVEYISKASSKDPLDIADYLRDLGVQTGDLFQKARDRFTANEIADGNTSYSRDFVYNFFGRKLLLLHPALEERELIVDRDRHIESDYSLWGPNWSVEIEGMRVPKEDILHRALRIALAKGKNGTRFQEGIREWKRMRNSEEKNGRRKKTLTKMAKEVTETLATAKVETTPINEFNLALGLNVAKAKSYRRERGRYRDDIRIIKRGNENRRRINELDEELRRENGGELPAEMVLPWALSVEDSRRRRSTVLLAAQRRAEFEATDVFKRDFFSQKIPVFDREEVYDLPAMDTPTIERMIEMLQHENEAIGMHAGSIIPAGFEVREVGRHIDLTINNLKLEISYLSRYRQRSEEPLTGAERRRLDKYVSLKISLTDLMEKAPEVLGIPKLFYEYSLASRIEALQKVLASRTRREVIEGKDVSQKKMKKAEFEMNVNVAQIEAPRIETAEEETVLLHHVHEWKDAPAISSHLKRFPFPPTVNSKEELLVWAEDMLSALPGLPLSFPRASHDYAPFELQQTNRRNQIQALTQLASMARSPLFPSDELLKGVKTSTLLSALSYRYGYLRAQAEIQIHRKTYNEKHNEFLNIAFDAYKLHLKQQHKKYEGQLVEVTARDPKKEFIKSMEALGLTMPIAEVPDN